MLEGRDLSIDFFFAFYRMEMKVGCKYKLKGKVCIVEANIKSYT